jgi:hypothetical protein
MAWACVWLESNVLDQRQIFGHAVQFLRQLLGQPTAANSSAKKLARPDLAGFG